ncbi:MAG: hypothetical protein ABSB32_04335 [Thermodesulfobacteriota bacterium]
MFAVYFPIGINIFKGRTLEPLEIRISRMKIHPLIPSNSIIVQGYKNNSTEKHGYDEGCMLFEKTPASSCSFLRC